MRKEAQEERNGKFKRDEELRRLEKNIKEITKQLREGDDEGTSVASSKV